MKKYLINPYLLFGVVTLALSLTSIQSYAGGIVKVDNLHDGHPGARFNEDNVCSLREALSVMKNRANRWGCVYTPDDNYNIIEVEGEQPTVRIEEPIIVSSTNNEWVNVRNKAVLRTTVAV